MKTTKWHFLDESDDEKYPYHYEGDMYEFSDGTTTFTARSYLDEPELAHFMCKAVRGQQRSVVKKDFRTELFRNSVEYLRREGKRSFRYLTRQNKKPYQEVEL